MSKVYKIVISVVAIICSILATGIGFGFVGSSDLLFSQKLLLNFIFMIQSLTTVWCVIALSKKATE